MLCAAQAALFIDVATITVCLPSIRAEFQLAPAGVQWVVSSYAIAFGGFLLVGGRMADRYGPRRMLVLGLSAFAVGTAGVGLAPGFVVLCLWRAIQGIGSALLAPAALALTNATFMREADRLAAFGLYGTALAGGFAVGALVSGALATVEWRAAMFVNVPLCVGVLGVIVAAPPPTARMRGQPIRVVPGIVATLAVGCTVFAASQAHAVGIGSWSIVAAACMAAGLAVLGVALRASERDTGTSPAAVDPERRTAMVAAALSAAAGGGSQYVATTYLQVARHEDTLATGAAVGSLGVAAVCAGRFAPRVLVHVGRRVALIGGLAIEATGAAALAVATTASASALYVGAAMAAVGFGLVLATVAYTTSALADVVATRSGRETGVLRSCEQIGGAIGLAVVVGLAGTRLGVAALVAAGFAALATGGIACIRHRPPARM